MAAALTWPVHAETQTIEITLKGTTFSPAEVKIPVGQNVVVKFKNLNAAPAEIESKPLKIEKVVQGGGDITANVKAKSAGKFLFVDEFHEDVAKGYFIAE
ncbi:cupredoxin domain-containing protein [Rhizobium sp. BR 362]